jgi:hypothetical protein
MAYDWEKMSMESDIRDAQDRAERVEHMHGEAPVNCGRRGTKRRRTSLRGWINLTS